MHDLKTRRERRPALRRAPPGDPPRHLLRGRPRPDGAGSSAPSSASCPGRRSSCTAIRFRTPTRTARLSTGDVRSSASRPPGGQSPWALSVSSATWRRRAARQVRGDVGERLQHEAALAQARVGEGQLGRVRLEVALEEEVDVERTGAEARRRGAGRRRAPAPWPERGPRPAGEPRAPARRCSGSRAGGPGRRRRCGRGRRRGADPARLRAGGGPAAGSRSTGPTLPPRASATGPARGHRAGSLLVVEVLFLFVVVAEVRVLEIRVSTDLVVAIGDRLVFLDVDRLGDDLGLAPPPRGLARGRRVSLASTSF